MRNLILATTAIVALSGGVANAQLAGAVGAGADTAGSLSSGASSTTGAMGAGVGGMAGGAGATGADGAVHGGASSTMRTPSVTVPGVRTPAPPPASGSVSSGGAVDTTTTTTTGVDDEAERRRAEGAVGARVGSQGATVGTDLKAGGLVSTPRPPSPTTGEANATVR